MHNEAIFLAAALALGGCAPMVFDKPGATQADFSEDSAKCRLMARGMNPGGFYAQGSASFVAGAAVGNAIGTAANQRATYKDCMMAAGYTVESPQVQALREAQSRSSPDCPCALGVHMMLRRRT